MEFIDLETEHRVSLGLIKQRIDAVAAHGRHVMGPEVGELEAQLESISGARHCIALASGADALAVALLALGVESGDEVIVPAFGSAAAVQAIVRAGATPVFADIDRATCNVDAASVDASITPRARAIIPVSLYGQPADMDELNAIARRHGLAVVEDAAHGFGATYRDRHSCNLSTLGCTSFAPGGPLACYADGGAVFTNDETLAARVRAIRARAQRSGAPRPAFGPMDTLQCAVVLARLERFEWELGQRRRVAAAYDALFCGRLQLVGRCRDRSSALAHYTVVLDERERVMAELCAAGTEAHVVGGLPAGLHAAGIEAQVAGGGLPAALPAAEVAGPSGHPVARAMAARVLSLPIGPYLGDDRVRRIGAAVLRAARVPFPARAEPAMAR